MNFNKFIKLNLSRGRGKCLINIEEIAVITRTNENVTEVYLKSETNGHCFEVDETIEEIKIKMRI